MSTAPSTSKSPSAVLAGFAWQGWQLRLPARWNPVKLEGNYDSGTMLIADMNRPQLGLRWKKMQMKRFDPMRELRAEVGALAAEKARAWERRDDSIWSQAVLFLEPEPPGRDVWAGHSRASGRVLEIVHHVRRRDRMLEDSILPAMTDAPPDEAKRWAIFDLSCLVPGGFELTTHRLNAGDLTLNFSCKRQTFSIRQIALAKMALDRLPLEKWLAQQERAIAKHYRPEGAARECSVAHLPGVSRISRRRRRFGWMRWLPSQAITYALHDVERDRLILVQGDDDSLLKHVAATIGQSPG